MPDLIRTKTQIPPWPPNHVLRPRLYERLAAIFDPALILVSAPTGFGKSTTVGAWVKTLGDNVAWVTLDAGDNDPTLFWSYLLAGMQSAGVSVGAGVSHTLGADSDTIVTTLINELVDRNKPLVLVLDDYHVIAERAIHAAIGSLLEHIPTRTTLVLITRADPPLALGRLRATGQMIELRAADLRFTPEEVRTFLHASMTPPPTPDNVAALASRTEGWPAGLQLAALALRGHPDPAAFVDTFAGSHHYIVEYLSEEVISQQPEDVQLFLLETAHLGQLSAPLCDAVTGRCNGESMLRHLREHNLFVVDLDSTQTWGRYQHLFADLLRHRQRQQLEPELIRELHARTSDWYRTNGQIRDAIEYALMGESYDRATRLLEDNWHHIQHRGEMSSMRRWLAALPDSLVKSSAPLSMAYCWLHFLAGERETVKARLADVQQAWNRREAEGNVPDREAWIVIPSLAQTVAAIVALQDGDAESGLEHALRALELIPDDPRVNRNLLVGAATSQLAQAYRELGQYEQSIAIMLDSLAQLKETNNIIGLVRGLHDLVQMHLASDRAIKAQEISDDILDHLSQHGYARLPLMALVHAARAEVALACNDHDVARALVDTALTVAGNSQYPLLVERLEALRSQLAAVEERAATLIEPLTDREMDVLRLLSAGYSNQEIADELVITEDTVKRHNTHIYGKLEVSNRTQAVLRAQDIGLL